MMKTGNNVMEVGKYESDIKVNKNRWWTGYSNKEKGEIYNYKLSSLPNYVLCFLPRE